MASDPAVERFAIRESHVGCILARNLGPVLLLSVVALIMVVMHLLAEPERTGQLVPEVTHFVNSDLQINPSDVSLGKLTHCAVPCRLTQDVAAMKSADAVI